MTAGQNALDALIPGDQVTARAPLQLRVSIAIPAHHER